MPRFSHTIDSHVYQFASLKELLAKATPLRSGDVLAGVAATSARERVAAQLALAEVPLSLFLNEALVPYEDDEVTRLIVDSHARAAFAPVSHLCVAISATGCSMTRRTRKRCRRWPPASRRKWRPPSRN